MGCLLRRIFHAPSFPIEVMTHESTNSFYETTIPFHTDLETTFAISVIQGNGTAASWKPH